MPRPERDEFGESLGETLSAKIKEQIRDEVLGTKRLPEGTVTILFTDVEGSSEVVRDLGDDAARKVLRRTDELIRDAVKACGGTEVEHPGDSFLIAFRTASSAASCALAILERIQRERDERPQTPLVRVGMDTGEVIPEDKGYFGSTVFRASRISDLAEGGQALTSQVTAVLADRAGFKLADAGEHELKGLGGTHRLYALVTPEA